MVYRLYVSGQAHRGSANPSSNRKTHRRVSRARRATGKKFILHSRIRLFCLGPAHVVLMGPLQWRLLWLYRGSRRTRDKNFFGFRLNIFPGWQALSRWSSTRGPYIETGAGVVHKRTRIYPMNLIWIFPIAFCDAAEPWQLGFQDPATPMMQGSAT
jgi:hypothetical protein